MSSSNDQTNEQHNPQNIVYNTRGAARRQNELANQEDDELPPPDTTTHGQEQKEGENLANQNNNNVLGDTSSSSTTAETVPQNFGQDAILAALTTLNQSMTTLSNRMDNVERNSRDPSSSGNNNNGNSNSNRNNLSVGDSYLLDVLGSTRTTPWQDIVNASTPAANDNPNRPSFNELFNNSYSPIGNANGRNRNVNNNVINNNHNQDANINNILSDHGTTARGIANVQRSLQNDAARLSLDNNTSSNDLNNSGRVNSSSMFNTLLNNTNSVSQNNVLIVRQEKECPVRIKKLELSIVAKAVKDIMNFQEEEQMQVRVCKVLTRELREHLKKIYDITSQALSVMSIETFFVIVGDHTKVTNPLRFIEELERALSHNKHMIKWDDTSHEGFEEYYLQHNDFIEEFKTIFKILLVNNSNHCPPIKRKKFGLIDLFQKLCASAYTDTIIDGNLANKRFNTMDEFFNAYQDILRAQYRILMAVNSIPFKSNTDERKRRAEKNFDDHFIRKSNKYNSYKKKFSKNPFIKKHYNNHKVNNISEEYDYPNEESDNELMWRDVNPNDSDNSYCASGDESDSNTPFDYVSEDEKEGIKTAVTRDDNIKDDSESDLIQHLCAIEFNKSPGLDKSKLACIRKLLSGKCERTNCEFGHRRDVLEKGAREMQTKIGAFLKSLDTSSGPNKAILARDKDQFKR